MKANILATHRQTVLEAGGRLAASVGELANARQASPDAVLQELERSDGDSTTAAIQLRDTQRALEHYNRLATLAGQPTLTLNDAMQQVADRTLAAITVVDQTASDATPELPLTTEVVIDAIQTKSYHEAGKLIGDVRQVVLDGAAALGLETVTPQDALFVLTEYTDPAKGNLRDAARSRAIDHHGLKEADRWTSQYEREVYEEVSSPSIVLRALTDAARQDDEAAAHWRDALVSELGELSSLSGESRESKLETLHESLEEVVPAAQWGLVDAAKTGDGATATLLDIVRASATKTTPITVSADASDAVRAIAIQAPRETTVWKWSGDNGLGIYHRNMSQGFGEELRRIAYVAHLEGRPPRLLELTHGVPTAALAFTDPQLVRGHGDHLCYFASRFDTPRIESAVVTPKNMAETYLAGEVPKGYQSWYERDLSWAGAGDKAGYDALLASGRHDVHVGDAVDQLRALAARGEKFDVALCPELAWTADRIALLSAFQGALTDRGRGFLVTETWAPQTFGRGTESIQRFADVVSVDGRDVPLSEYLADNYPEHFEVLHFSGGQALVAKGSKDPVELPEMTPEAIEGRTVQFGLPVLRWTITGPAKRPAAKTQVTAPQRSWRNLWGAL